MTTSGRDQQRQRPAPVNDQQQERSSNSRSKGALSLRQLWDKSGKASNNWSSHNQETCTQGYQILCQHSFVLAQLPPLRKIQSGAAEPSDPGSQGEREAHRCVQHQSSDSAWLNPHHLGDGHLLCLLRRHPPHHVRNLHISAYAISAALTSCHHWGCWARRCWATLLPSLLPLSHASLFAALAIPIPTQCLKASSVFVIVFVFCYRIVSSIFRTIQQLATAQASSYLYHKQCK